MQNGGYCSRKSRRGTAPETAQPCLSVARVNINKWILEKNKSPWQTREENGAPLGWNVMARKHMNKKRDKKRDKTDKRNNAPDFSSASSRAFSRWTGR